MSLESRFNGKIRKTDTCWIWTGATAEGRYGVIWVGGSKRNKYAHRVAWELANGADVPEGFVVMHSCDNGLCVNPGHLSVGTHYDNKADCVSKRRHAFGERNGGGRRLTAHGAREIRSLRGLVSITETAKRFGVSVNTVKQIRRGRLWREA